MRRPWIAGLLLITLTGWVALPAWSGIKPAHAPSVSGAPASHAGHTNGNHHPCCPGLTPQVLTRILLPSTRCDSEHSCCFAQNPGIPSTLPVRSENTNGCGQVLGTLPASDMVQTSGAALVTEILAPPIQPPLRWNMVLRV